MYPNRSGYLQLFYPVVNLIMCSMYYIAHVSNRLEYNHSQAVKWMQQWSRGTNSGGTCIPMDLGTYNNFIKHIIDVNNVFYPLHSLFVDKHEI